MGQCNKCGAYLADNDQVCRRCGTPVVGYYQNNMQYGNSWQNQSTDYNQQQYENQQISEQQYNRERRWEMEYGLDNSSNGNKKRKRKRKRVPTGIIITIIVVAVLLLAGGGFVLFRHIVGSGKDNGSDSNKEVYATDTDARSSEVSEVSEETTENTTENITSKDSQNSTEQITTEDLQNDTYNKSGTTKSIGEWIAPAECRSVEEIAKSVNDYIMAGCQEKLTIHTKGVKQSDLANINDLMTQVFGRVESTLYNEDGADEADIDISLKYDDAYYVYMNWVYGVQLPDDNDRAKLIYDSVSDMLDGENIESMNDYDKEIFFHDYLTEYTEYDGEALEDAENTDAYTVYGLFENKKCVCEGYARTMGLLLSISGIENYYVTGEAKSSLSDKMEPHAWNIAKIDGKWYHVDVTWDDPVGDQILDNYYNYLNVSDSVLSQDRTWNESLYPACESMDANYFKVSDLYFDTYDQFMAYAETELDKNNGSGTVVAAVSDYDAEVYDVDKIHTNLYPQSELVYNVSNVSNDYTIIILQY